jgi:acyl transferase domain-containing protein
MKPIAIVGIGCRFPGGVSNPAKLWSLLTRGDAAISEVPADRFDINTLYAPAPSPDRVTSRYGGFVDGVWEFDAEFFRISPHEATLLDPQQRLLLQTVWEAVEDAGIRPSTLAGSRTGVFVALHLNDYARRCGIGRPGVAGLVGTGQSGAAAGLAFALNLRGPTLVVDTDHSSSLVALHHACAAIGNDECDVAIIGGANLILGPGVSIAFSAAGMLAPDGRCKFADADADGSVRGEGVAAVVVRPLDAALRNGDPVYAVIRGSAVQASGNLSGDLLAPSPEAQATLIAEACRRSEAAPRDIVYVEAHGTGSAIGDAAELLALGRIVGGGDRPTPCWVGSIKSNIGHSEGCAGLAGLIKVALAAAHKQIPPSLHFRELPPALASKDLGLRVPTTLQHIPDDVDFVAGVSSFGLTGINAHAIVAEPPRSAAERVPSDTIASTSVAVLSISAHHPEGLRELAARYLQLVGDAHVDLNAVCRSAALRREHRAHRASFVAPSREALVAGLASFAQGGGPPTGFVTGTAPANVTSKIVFVFPGQGGQWTAMGRALLTESRAFAETVERCDPIVRKLAGWSPLDELRGEPRLERIDVVQPLLVVMELGLAALWMAWGLRPSAVVGTSIGEIAAAHVSGALALEDALTIVCESSRLMCSVAGQGAMAVVDLPLREAMAGLDATKVAVAGTNSHSSTLLSGERSAIESAVKAFQARHVFAQLVRIDVAFHSAHVEPVLAPLAASLKFIAPCEGTIPFYSTVRRGRVEGRALTSNYWVDNVRQPIEFSDVVQLLLTERHTVFIEISPHPILRSPLLDGIAYARFDAVVVGTLKRNEDPLCAALESLASLHVAGHPVDWTGVLPVGRSHRLPCTPWNATTYRIDSPADARPSLLNLDDASRNAGEPRHVPSLLDRLRSAPVSTRLPTLTEALQAELANVLRMPVSSVDLERPFRDLGLTSLAGTEFRLAIDRLVGRRHPSALLFNHPNLSALATHLCTHLFASEDPSIDLIAQSTRPIPRLDDPIAIIGIGLRFPGGITSLDDLWAVLKDGRDTIREIPHDRWDGARLYDPNPKAPGKMNTQWGSFVEEIDRFDPQFFAISPREAESMDPQQRLLLELSWEAFENAGIPRARLLKSATGVFVGMMNTNEYARRKNIDSDLTRVTPHTSSGDAMSIASGRISYFFGLQGPALTIDTACSSSLVALHLAATSLRIGECTAALVAGVNLIASPSTTMSFAKTRMLSPRGRCRTFDASADGYVRAEGGCALVVKRLSDAIADRDNILAVVRGTAVNQDGRSSGLTAPNGLAQRAVMGKALAASGISPSEVSYVEAHGTGTPLGDPIEVQAIADVFRGSHDTSNPLYLGALKANLGHMEACAGLAGVAKLIVLMRQHELPRQINLEELNPKLGIPEWLVIPRKRQAWIPPGHRRIAGVTSFGFSGTNAHAVLEAVSPHERDSEHAARSHTVFCVSGVSPEALQSVARRLQESCAAAPSQDVIDDLAYSSACRREHFPFRAAFVAGTRATALGRLEALATGTNSGDVFGPTERVQSPKIGFLYSGESSYPLGVCSHLYANEPLFRAPFDRYSRLIAAETGLALVDSLFGDTSKPAQDLEARLAHFALQYALTEMWTAWGVAPSAALGDGVGQYAASHTVGVVDLATLVTLLVRSTELPDAGAPKPPSASTSGSPEAPRIPCISTTRAGSDDVGALVQLGCSILIEVGPGPVLLRRVQESVGKDALCIPSLCGDHSDLGYMSEVLARLFVAGVNVDWNRFYHGHARAFLPLPPHPFTRRRYWIDEATATTVAPENRAPSKS